jgi:hypothetical protein
VGNSRTSDAGKAVMWWKELSIREASLDSWSCYSVALNKGRFSAFSQGLSFLKEN